MGKRFLFVELDIVTLVLFFNIVLRYFIPLLPYGHNRGFRQPEILPVQMESIDDVRNKFEKINSSKSNMAFYLLCSMAVVWVF